MLFSSKQCETFGENLSEATTIGHFRIMDSLANLAIKAVAQRLSQYTSLPVPAELKERLLNYIIQHGLIENVNLALFVDTGLKNFEVPSFWSIDAKGLAEIVKRFSFEIFYRS